MNENNNFYKNFDTSNKSKNIFLKIIIPFVSGIMGGVLILSISFGIPSIRNKLLSISSANTSSDLVQTSSTVNSGTVDYVSLANYSDTAIYASNKILPSIVGIKVDYTITSNFMYNLGQTSSAEAEGSGIIISEDGYILTNNHIINSTDSSSYYTISEATSITVYLYNDETPYEAEIIGTDSETDLAIIKINKTGLTAAELGNSDDVKVGEFVLAIGNPLGMQSSVTSGIVSAVNREVTSDDGTTYNLIQTDAAINSGNSGGALVNSEGQVIGINTLKMSGTGIEGMGFAIPINDTIDIYTQLIENGKVSRPYIGITGIDLTNEQANYYNLQLGIYVKSIEGSSPAENAGFKIGDVIVSIDGTKIATMDELNNIKETKSIGDTIVIGIYRNNEYLELNVTLGEQP